MYEHIPSPLFCMWLQHQAKILGHGYGNGYGLWLGLLDPGSPGYKDKPMWCLGHPIHFITFHSMSNLYKIYWVAVIYLVSNFNLDHAVDYDIVTPPTAYS